MTALPPDLMQGFKPLAVVRNEAFWGDIRAALRGRADALAISRQTIDRLGGLPDGLASKLLMPLRSAKFGVQSLAYILGAMGCLLVVVEDLEVTERLRNRGRLVPRNAAAVRAYAGDARAGARGRSWVSKGDREWGITMNHRRNAVLHPTRRRAIARRAAVIRWRGLGRPEAAP